METVKNTVKKNSFTRSHGLLENLLSCKRAELADKLIDNDLRAGNVLDIGCGLFPYFLTKTNFKKKYGVDKVIDNNAFPNNKTISLQQKDIEKDKLPFKDNYFKAVVMLAVFEHIKPENLDFLMKEIFRVLEKDGVLIITTPAPWSVPLLFILSRVGIISRVEIEDHKSSFSARSVSKCLEKTGFKKEKITSGYFEVYLNMWFKAKK